MLTENEKQEYLKSGTFVKSETLDPKKLKINLSNEYSNAIIPDCVRALEQYSFEFKSMYLFLRAAVSIWDSACPNITDREKELRVVAKNILSEIVKDKPHLENM